MDEFCAEGWIARCHKCGKKEHTPVQHKGDAEKTLHATGRWYVGERDLCTDCAEELKRESQQ